MSWAFPGAAGPADVYVTGSAGRNPYRALPAYWSHEDAIIAAYCAA